MGTEQSEKLAKALLARHRLEDLYHEVYGPSSRALHRFIDSLPLSSIPLVAAWSLALAFASHEAAAIYDWPRMYLSGLVVLGALCAMAMAVRRALDLREMPDEVLAEMAVEHDIFAFYPNSLLKRTLSRRGSANRHDFREWYLRQREILDNRVRDLREAAQQAPTGKVALDALKPGARAFMSR